MHWVLCTSTAQAEPMLLSVTIITFGKGYYTTLETVWKFLRATARKLLR